MASPIPSRGPNPSPASGGAGPPPADEVPETPTQLTRDGVPALDSEMKSTREQQDAFEATPARALRTPPVAAAAAPDPHLEQVPLASTRFAADPVLQRVAAGTATLPANANGSQGRAAVKLVQQSLADLGFALPSFGADGDWGAETKLAMSRFQKSMGLPATGALDAATLATLDRAAPPPGQGVHTYPEYERMFQDGVLHATLGVGFDETGADKYETWEIQRGLKDQGFQSLNVSSLGDVQLIALGLDPAKLDRSATYYLKVFDYHGKPVRALLRYVDRNDPSAKQHFADGFASSELVMYAGHARYGSGPDFDPKDSNKGNFVLGVNGAGHRRGSLTPSYDAHMRELLRGAPNDLEKAAMTPDYQMMFFSGCRTRDYRDELRGIPANKNASNLDLILSTDLLMWNNMSANVLGLLDGVTHGKSMEELNDELYATNRVKFVWDGFGDNPKR